MNPPDDEGDMEFNPWSEKIAYATGQLSPGTQLLSLCSVTTEAIAMRSPCSTTGENLHATVKPQHSQK